MTRHDKSGRNVTELPGLWSESDCEITSSNFRDPAVTTGQHTNGPAQVFIRLCTRPDYPWVPTQMNQAHKVVALWAEKGIDAFLPF
jgi:hypothetical protein